MSGDSSDGARFRRTGTVTAFRLEAPHTWRTSTGDQFVAAVGDWWVVSQDGSGRSVAPEPFAESYEQVAGNTYRRTGVVRARRVVRREVVATLEGEATAESGMWVVTDAAGRRWPVPDDEFRRGYEAV